MKFAHFSDCHLGAWRYPELRLLNFQSFQQAVNLSIKEKVEFVLMSGDIFDSAYPPVEVLKESFAEFLRLKNAGIPCFIIAGSHDYSASGKSFLEVAEKGGLCVNVHKTEERNGSIVLLPTLYRNYAIYGYPGKRSSMEIPDLKKISLQDAPGYYKILMLHTALSFASHDKMESINEEDLPKADYYALGHLHIDNPYKNFIYGGPTFPNNFQELEELQAGKFYIIDNHQYRRINLKLKDVESVSVEIKNTFLANQIILSELSRRNIINKIVLLRLHGRVEKGRMSNINFSEIEEYARSQGCYTLIRSTSQLSFSESETEASIIEEVEDMAQLEMGIVKEYSESNSSEFNSMILPLMKSFDMEKKEDEKSETYIGRLLEEAQKTIRYDDIKEVED